LCARNPMMESKFSVEDVRIKDLPEFLYGTHIAFLGPDRIRIELILFQ